MDTQLLLCGCPPARTIPPNFCSALPPGEFSPEKPCGIGLAEDATVDVGDSVLDGTVDVSEDEAIVDFVAEEAEVVVAFVVTDVMLVVPDESDELKERTAHCPISSSCATRQSTVAGR